MRVLRNAMQKTNLSKNCGVKSALDEALRMHNEQRKDPQQHKNATGAPQGGPATLKARKRSTVRIDM